MNVKSRKAERSESTRSALLKVARELFVERGYVDTPTEDIVKRARVTRGALYYHFRNKKHLFEAVFEDMEREFAQQVLEASLTLGDPWEHLRAGMQAFLDACLDPAIQRIVFLDAPSVLGWEKWREIDAKYGFGMLKNGLQATMDAGLIRTQPAEPLAHLLLGALVEAAMVIARAEDIGAARAEVGETLDQLLEGLRVSDI